MKLPTLTKKEKNQHYDITPIATVDAQYKAIIGERSNGKSYAAKVTALEYAWENDTIFIYLRRYYEDIKSMNVVGVAGYFRDMVENDDGGHEIERITNGKCNEIAMYQGTVYFAYKDENDDIKRVKPMCLCMCLSRDEHYKSMSVVKTKLMLFEEFIAPLDKPFLPREYRTFMSIISTVFRRREGVVYMIANTTKIVCPYFTEWGIKADKLEMGKIVVVHHETQDCDDDGKPIVTDIAVEYTDNVAGNSHMFTGKNRDMIMGGQWDTNSYPHLEGHLTEYTKWYKMFIHIDDHRFILHVLTKPNDRFPFLYVYPYEKDKLDNVNNIRTISNHFRLSTMVSNSFAIYRTKYDKLVHKLLKEKRIVFSDNMCGTTFYEILKTCGNII